MFLLVKEYEFIFVFLALQKITFWRMEMMKNNLRLSRDYKINLEIEQKNIIL